MWCLWFCDTVRLDYSEDLLHLCTRTYNEPNPNKASVRSCEIFSGQPLLVSTADRLLYMGSLRSLDAIAVITTLQSGHLTNTHDIADKLNGIGVTALRLDKLGRLHAITCDTWRSARVRVGHTEHIAHVGCKRAASASRDLGLKKYGPF
jgi:hypothetical protein